MNEVIDNGPSDGAWTRRHDVLYHTEMSALYHQKRERFFELWDKLTKAFSLIGGSAALYKASDPSVVAVIAVAITTGSALSLVFGFSERARRHSELSREFKNLIADIFKIGPFQFTEENINQWNEARYRIDAKEPPALGLLVQICQNEMAVSQNQSHNIVPIKFGMRLIAHFIDWPVPSQIKTEPTRVCLLGKFWRWVFKGEIKDDKS
ncbi:hypothetical protein [Burkholderia gladioli]|uniref:hypothetical protein n=1 Tax=Burkholderia gladioli TaxID=28095 RepID=UPI000F53D20B|nr:hypothetical protein [Burkholderia gladioli]